MKALIQTAKKLLAPVLLPEPPATHDYSRTTWGHDYVIHQVIDNGQRLRVSGWGHGISNGDFIVMSNPPGTTRYRVDNIDYRCDPPDMWFADLSFAPRRQES